jgi:hypothetical protein
MITVTNNYFADLNTAIEAGIFPANSKPKKAALYDAIVNHNSNEAIANPEPLQDATPPASSLDVPQLPIDVAALEAAGDEAAVQEALLAMDAAEPQPVAAVKEPKVRRPAKSAEQVFEELECLMADVEAKGIKAIAELLGTSEGRLRKKVKAYLLLKREDVLQGFTTGCFSYSFLCEMAVRRDGLEQLQAKIAARAQSAA